MLVTKTEFLNNYCRICGETDNICVDLMCEEKYFDKVKELLPLQIEPTDCLPTNLCHICLAKIEEFDTLRKNCTIAQKTLIAIARTITEEETDSPDDESDIEILEVINSSNYNPLPRREESDVLIFESKSSNLPMNGSQDGSSDGETITIDTNESSEENCSQETAPRRDLPCELVRGPASEPRRDSASEPRRDSSDPISLDGWTVQRIPGKEHITLYICNKCSLMLLYENAIRAHNCGESVLVTPLLDENDLNNENRSEIDQGVRKKRKRIYFADDG